MIPCCLSQREGLGKNLNETHFSHSEIPDAVIWYCFPAFLFHVSFGMLTYVFFFFFSEDKSYQIFPLFKLLHTKKKKSVFRFNRV